mgnify:CR=1 FL=1
MLVLKFGGTSMGSADAIKQVADIVKQKLKESPVLVVVSAKHLVVQCSEVGPLVAYAQAG